MNIVFWLLVIIAIFLVWVIISCFYSPLGKLMYKNYNIFQQNVNKELVITEEEKKEKENETNENN